MSKHIASIPLADIERIAIVTGNGRSMAQVKGDADYICNAGFYDMTTGRPVGHLKADGAVLAKEAWGCWGFAWDKSDIKMSALPDAKRTNYISGVEMLSPMIGIHDAMHYRPEVGGSRPRTAMALTGDKLLLYCADSPTTPEALRDTLYKLGAETAIMLDGGGSSQCDFQGKKNQQQPPGTQLSGGVAAEKGGQACEQNRMPRPRPRGGEPRQVQPG